MTLAHTSALVLLMTKDKVYQTKAARNYLAALDLSAGEDLYKTITDFFPDYDEVIQNRKYAVLRFIEHLLVHENLPEQIILPAAGMDAMGLEIATLYPGAHIYELDRDNMPQKRTLIDHPNCHHIEADVTDTQACYDKMRAAGWDEDQSSLIILEGISYYIDAHHLTALIETFAPRSAIVEYHTLPAMLSDRARQISRHCFSEILGLTGYEKMSVYTTKQLETLVGLPHIETHNMTKLEKMRHKRNKNFRHAHDGWIEISLFGTMPNQQ